MKRDHARNLLEQGLAELAKARTHLNYSFQQVSELPDTLVGATEHQLESAEAFTGRFARSVDLLVNQVLRTLDRVELKTEGTLLDLINRAEKRGFVTPSEELREMKDVRNIIAHDYAFKGQLPQFHQFMPEDYPISTPETGRSQHPWFAGSIRVRWPAWRDGHRSSNCRPFPPASTGRTRS